jgi:TonB family protein
MNSRVFPLALSLVVLSAPAGLFAQASAAHLSGASTAAVDAKGAWHQSSQYPGKLPPWMVDRIWSIAPDYPYSERARRHAGSGYFQVTLDTKTGAVTKVAVRKSTGFPTLDNCAVAALRQWRWKPGKWREVEMPVTFKLASPPPLPRGSVPLPLR